jgi:sugar phosphate permease
VKVAPRYFILAITVTIQMATSLLQQGVGAIQPFITGRLQLDHQHAGLIVAAISAGSAVFVAIAGVAVDYFGEKTVILWSGVVMGLAACAAAVEPNLAWLVACLFIFGMAYGTSSPAGARAVLLWFKNDRGLAMGIRQSGVPLGGFFGSLLLPVVAFHWGYQASFATAGVICIVITVVGIRGYHQPVEAGQPERQTIPEVWRGMLKISRSWRSIWVNLTCSTLVAVQFTALSFFALAVIAVKNVSVPVAAASMAIFQVGAIAGRLIWGSLSDRVFGGDRVLPMVVVCAVSSADLVWLAQPGHGSVAAVFAIAAILGVSGAAWNGLFATVQAEIGGPQLAGSAVGAGFAIIYLVGAIVPPLFGGVVDRFGFSTAWRLLAAVAALGIVPGLLARRLLYPQRARA